MAADALEKGLGLQTTKLGPGDKELGYAMPQQRAKYFGLGILSTVLLLVVLAALYAWMYDAERLRRAFDNQVNMNKLAGEKADVVRLQLLLHQEQSANGKQIDDAKRAMNRITNVIHHQFALLAEKTGSTPGDLVEFRDNLASFVASEVVAFQRDLDVLNTQQKTRLDRMSKFQAKSLRELLTSMSHVRLSEFQSMIEDVFEAGSKAREMDVSVEQLEQLERLADQLYEGAILVPQAKQEFARIRGSQPWEEEIATEDGGEMAEQLEALIDAGQLARGKKELRAIEDKYKLGMAYDGSSDSDGEPEERDAFVQEIETSVNTIMAIHQLMSEGKVPFHMLDFEAIALEDGDEEDDSGQDAEGSK